MYRLNTENGGFTPDKSRGSKAPRVEGPEGFIWRKADVRVHYPLFPTLEFIIHYFRRDYIQKPPPDFKTHYCS